MGDAACIVGAVTMVNDLAPDSRRGEAYSLYSLSAWAGLGLGPVIGDFVHRATSFDAVWVVAIGLSLSGAAPGRHPPGDEAADRAVRGRAFALFSRYAAIPGAVIALEMFGFAALVVFSPLYARELGMQGAGLVLLVNAAVLVAMRVLGRRLPDRVGPRRAASAGVMLAAGGIGLAAALGSPAGLYLGAAIFGAGHALLYPALFLLAVGRAPEDERSAALGSLKALEGLGFAVRRRVHRPRRLARRVRPRVRGGGGGHRHRADPAPRVPAALSARTTRPGSSMIDIRCSNLLGSRRRAGSMHAPVRMRWKGQARG